MSDNINNNTMVLKLNDTLETFGQKYLKDWLKKNGSNIIKATKIAEMPNKGGFVFLQADEDIQGVLAESLESSIDGLKFDKVFEDVQFVPNKKDGDKYDALFAFKIRGGPKEYRQQIAEWKKNLNEMFEKGQFKTVSQYKARRLKKKRKHDDSEDAENSNSEESASKNDAGGDDKKDDGDDAENKKTQKTKSTKSTTATTAPKKKKVKKNQENKKKKKGDEAQVDNSNDKQEKKKEEKKESVVVVAAAAVPDAAEENNTSTDSDEENQDSSSSD